VAANGGGVGGGIWWWHLEEKSFNGSHGSSVRGDEVRVHVDAISCCYNWGCDCRPMTASHDSLQPCRVECPRCVRLESHQ
jgi:hypothetical protein